MKWANKKQIILIFTKLHFLKKNIKKNTCRYHYQNLDDMIYSSWDIEQNILKLVILGHFLPFIPLKTPKINILKNEKICWRYHHSTNVQQKSQSYDVQFLRYGQKFLSFCAIFCPFTSPLIIPNVKILKEKKKMAGDVILLHIYVYHKRRSYEIWFLKYKVQQTEIFNILGHFLPFQPLDNLENQNFNTEKNTWRYYHFTHLHHKWQSYDVWFLRYGVQQTEFFVILDHFLPFYPPMDPENQNFEKMKKIPEDIIILQT